MAAGAHENAPWRRHARTSVQLCPWLLLGCIEQHPDWVRAEFGGDASDAGDTTDTTDTHEDSASDTAGNGSGSGDATITGDTSSATSVSADTSTTATAGDTSSSETGSDATTATGESGTTATDTDTDTDGEPTSCAALWQLDTWTLEPPRELVALNSVELDGEPSFSPDGLSLYFSSGAGGNQDIYVASRPSSTDEFADPVAVDWVNTADREFTFALTADALTVFVTSDRAGGAGDMDIWTAERATSDDPFSPLVPVDELNTSEPQWDAFPTRDGLRLYWTTGEQTNVNLHYADRDTRDDPFGAATVVDVDAPDAYEDSPVLTANDLVFLFGSTRPGGPGGHDLWFAKRATTGDAFGVPQLLPGVNGASREGELAVSPDACELLFASDRDGTGGWDLYATRLVAP